MNTTQVCPRADYVSHLMWFISHKVLANNPTPIPSKCTNTMIERILNGNWNSSYAEAEPYNGGMHIHITRETYNEMLTFLSISDDKYEAFFATFDLVLKTLTKMENINVVSGESGPLDIFCS